MDIKITLSESQTKELVDFYKKELDKINFRKREVEELLSNLGWNKKPSTGQLSILDKMKKTAVDGYNVKWPFSQKIVFVISKFNRCVTTREIVDEIKSYEPEKYESKINSTKLLSVVSGIISAKIKNKKLFNRYKPFIGADHHIGLIDWFDHQGNLLEVYKAIK